MQFKRTSFYIALIRIYLFWLLFFAFGRLLFIVVNNAIIGNSGASFGETIQAFWYAIPLDIAIISFMTAISWIILSVQSFYNRKFIDTLHRWFYYIMIVINSMILIGDIGIYPEWKMKLNFKALEYLTRPEEVLESNPVYKSIFEILLIVGVSAIFIWLFKRFFFQKQFGKKQSVLAKAVFLSLLPGLIFLGMRGGIQEIPISQSQSYYSQNDVLNDLAVNTTWNLVFSLIHTLEISDENIFEAYPPAEAEKIVRDLHAVPKDTTISILNTPKPNILFIILESWSGDLVHALGGRPGLTPRFDSLINDGLFFTHLYSSGNRSQQGLASLLGGFPALPITTLTTTPEKMRQTPTVTRLYNDAGYHSAFYYGGQLRYGNIKAYLLHNQFQTIVEVGDLNLKAKPGKLGYPDGVMFPYLLDRLNESKQPFFVNFFTLSSHSPYDQPMKDVIKWGDSEDPFHNSAYYADSCLGDFMAAAKKQSWYKNTLIVLVADHSHQTYTHRAIHTADYRKIPLLITGGALKKEFVGKKYEKVCSQTDIAATVLKQLGMDATAFPWSKNMFNPYTKEFAYFELIQGYGFIKPQGFISYYHFSNQVLSTTLPDSLQQEALKDGGAYLQVLFQEYIDL